MNAITRRALVDPAAPISGASEETKERTARNRLIARGVITGREPSKLDVVARYRGKRAILTMPADGKGGA
ncbi:hypothetical protein [Reyranella sp.]|jgi:hypothetical protein|uniref:hypothetical protein n=1 Tax=Reyranella sp. TaxID=1929291 RepID=UPI000BCC81B7|nr:hypothetical protein [Reyranella sp.]OYY35584.1 MAG: hypothetical protein B7Y57_25735 [Rhodospirillales bacterium 35-66-84]OYZ91454.1 MAG: hypothetical protein B7Y08_25605 [Rhodospirillales bacterium 24-66-33]OZB21991.1 MAG: hypothetical protein B7X63_24530 [Rhodospirillales bacterium 39-66-50]HQS14992.1 hypothetical protein [Reyranella sp.]HQT10801.1 hypothetical protein [Reyranella sp.]